jgi:transcriptional regulator with XRE-family HTH domain
MRPAYHELALPGRRRPIICGRKFCTGCGRWRHICDFGAYQGRIRSRCRACQRAYQRAWHANATPEQRERINEYYRIWTEAKRREQGKPRRRFRRKLPVERVFFPTAPLLEVLEAAINDATVPGWETIGRRAGIDTHTIRRIRFGESARVRLDIADRLAHAVGLPLALVYPDEYREERRAV